jgi:hypothetical protein
LTSEAIADLDEILLDTGPFCRFCEANALVELASYLDVRAWITQDVANEIHYRGKRQHAALRTLQWQRPPFPQNEPVVLTGAHAKQAARIHARKQQPGDPPAADLGEITTVLAAVASGGAAVMIDDRFGRDLARQRLLSLYSTADLAAEMTAFGTIDGRLGWRIFRSVFTEKRIAFEQAVENARQRLAQR